MAEIATIECAIEHQTARLVISNPRRANALTMAMIEELDHALARIERSSARVVLIRGAGERFFCAGADIGEWGPLSPESMGRYWIGEGNRVFQRLAHLDAVVIAQINGDAYGGGLEVALCADIRFMADHVKLGFPEVGIGAIPGWMGCTRLQSLIGSGRAKQMILSGEPIGAQIAQSWGLVNEAVAADQLEARVQQLSATIVAKSSTAISAAKRVLNASLDTERFAAVHELAVSAVKASPDAVEGVAAFREKRKPNFPGNTQE
ncbi:MAG: enoyl-CoA hydratase/isomerase family protein [Burkholderiales bacterium]